MTSTLLNRLVLALSLLGIFVAGILSYSSALHVEVPCAANATTSCAAVTSSPAGELLGIKVSYLGLAAYAAIFGLAVARSRATGAKWLSITKAGFWLTGVGLAFSLYLQTVSITQIRQLCAWCLTSAVTMLALFIVHGMISQRGEEPVAEDKDPEKVWFMRRKADNTVVAVCAVLALAAFGFTASDMKKATTTALNMDLSKFTMEDLMTDPAKMAGNPDAKVQIVEVADILCPTCRSTFPQMKELLKKHDGKIQNYYISFPLYNIPGHETSIPAAMIASYAAEKGQFWKFLELAFESSNDERVKSESGLIGIAADAGFDTDDLKKRMNTELDTSLLDSVNNDFHKAAIELKIQGTPTFIMSVNGGPLEAYTFEGLKAALDRPDVRRYLN